MKAIHNIRLYIWIILSMMYALGVTAQDYSPLRENLPPYIFETSKKYYDLTSTYLRGTIDSVINNGQSRDFYPYNTLVVTDNGTPNCLFKLHHSWMGKRISVNDGEGTATFSYQNVYDKDFPLQTHELLLNYSKGPGYQWMAASNDSIMATIVSVKQASWRGIIDDSIKVIQLQYVGSNSKIQWSTGDIVVSKQHGILSFPDLRYFPFEWDTVELAGGPGFPVFDPSARDMYDMKAGQGYTAESKYGIGVQYPDYKKVKCLEILSDVPNKVTRRVQIIDVSYSYTEQKWQSDTSVKVEVIDFDSILINKPVDTFFPLNDINNTYRYILMNKSRQKSSFFFGPPDDDNCVPMATDQCDYYGFNRGFATYWDCAGFVEFDYNLPVFIDYGDDTWGHDINLDSLLTNKKISSLEGVTISPNPASNHFYMTIPPQINLSKVFMTDILGSRVAVKAEKIDAERLELNVNAPGGVYLITGVDVAGNTYFLGKVVLIEK
ncbi:MAG: hypothetical protein J5I59_08315 [Saprospiraceae bacterium]|nr:hypothetical protein [Saprospiraceae bacterium]